MSTLDISWCKTILYSLTSSSEHYNLYFKLTKICDSTKSRVITALQSMLARTARDTVGVKTVLKLSCTVVFTCCTEVFYWLFRMLMWVFLSWTSEYNSNKNVKSGSTKPFSASFYEFHYKVSLFSHKVAHRCADSQESVERWRRGSSICPFFYSFITIFTCLTEHLMRKMNYGAQISSQCHTTWALDALSRWSYALQAAGETQILLQRIWAGVTSAQRLAGSCVFGPLSFSNAFYL